MFGASDEAKKALNELRESKSEYLCSNWNHALGYTGLESMDSYPEYIVKYLQDNGQSKLTASEFYWYSWIDRIEGRLRKGYDVSEEDKTALNNCRARFNLPPVDIRIYTKTQEEIDLQDAMAELDKEFPPLADNKTGG